MTATHTSDATAAVAPVLCLALDLGWNSWKLAFSVGLGQKPRIKTIAARVPALLLAEIKAAKKRFNLPEDTPVVSCYEAGRDGFWLHRCLLAHGVQSHVVDSASIEINRRQRRAKSDRLDVVKLLEMLLRYRNGETKVWAVVRAPSADDEDARQLHRELLALKAERTSHSNSIKGLLAGLGLGTVVDDRLLERLDNLRQWDGSKVPAGLRARLLREFARWQLAGQQIHELEAERTRRIREESGPPIDQVRRLLNLKGIGENGAWLLVWEFFGWRGFRNRRQVASLAGLTPTPYTSGESRREQGISKAGNRRVRCMAIELAWGWLRYQPQSELTRWYLRRFGAGNTRLRKVGIVALARKLLIALWKYLETGESPGGAEVVGWDKKPKFRVIKLKRRKAS
jgi:transposase